MFSLLPNRRFHSPLRRILTMLFPIGILWIGQNAMAQNTPIISGGLGFLTNTTGGNTNYFAPEFMPVLVAPLGEHLLIESRLLAVESFSPKGDGQGYGHFHFVAPAFAQADYVATSHVTAVGGYFLIPFGTYNDRLTPIWINPLQDGPLLYGIGTMGSGSGLGGMLRGNAISRQNFSLNYSAYLSSGSTNSRFTSSRSTGGQLNAYFPNAGLEIGTSYGRLLETTQANAIGAHVWWGPANLPLKLHSEYAHGPHSQGYWVEADYRLSQFHGETSLVGRLEPIVRIQQTFRNSPGSDGVPSADTQRVDFGLDYHLPHEVRINTSYARRFSSTGNVNVWETALIYHFVFPAWRGK
jgi:hypothetical protein